MDYRKLMWSGDFMASELGLLEVTGEDVAVGIYSLVDFPQINVYIDMENEKFLEVWLDNDEE